MTVALSMAEAQVYTILRAAVSARTSDDAPPVLVISDIAKDYDDLSALLVLVELHRLNVIRLVGIVTNLEPARKRARFARGAFNSLNLEDIPVAYGLSATDEEHPELEHEFSYCPFMVAEETIFPNGQEFMAEIMRRTTGLSLLCLSSLADISALSISHPDVIAKSVAHVFMQGGHSPALIPDPDAANNRFDMSSAHQWHAFIQSHDIPSTTFTKYAAFGTSIPASLFINLEETGHPIGTYLRQVHIAQDLAFYAAACDPDPAKRFQPFMDQEWYLRYRTSWFSSSNPGRPPQGREIVPYLTNLVLYDAIAAIGACGQDVVAALGIFTSSEFLGLHALVGTANDPGVTSTMPLVLSALMKGALLSHRNLCE